MASLHINFTGPNAKLHRITIVTLTELLAIKIVANNRSGLSINVLIAFFLGESSSSSSWAGVREKYAISLPEIKPEIKRPTIAIDSATIWAMPNSIGATCNKKAVAGKGSISKIIDIS